MSTARVALVTRTLTFLVMESVLIGAFFMTGLHKSGRGEKLIASVCFVACLYLTFRVLQLIGRLRAMVGNAAPPPYLPSQDPWTGPPPDAKP